MENNNKEYPFQGEKRGTPRHLMTQAELRSEAEQRAQAVYRRFQAATKKTERETSEILKGMLRGENPYKLLERACAVIGALTDDGGVMAKQAAQNITAVYGAGVLKPPALEKEITEIRKRLQLLQRPELEQTETPDNLRRIQAAIREHRKRLAELEKMGGKKNESL